MFPPDLQDSVPVLCTVRACVHVCMCARLHIQQTNRQTNTWMTTPHVHEHVQEPPLLLLFIFHVQSLWFQLEPTDKLVLSQASAPDPWRKKNTGKFFLLAAQRHFLWRKHPDNKVSEKAFPGCRLPPRSGMGLLD